VYLLQNYRVFLFNLNYFFSKISFYFKNPLLLIDLVVGFFFATTAILLLIATCISMFVNPYLDPFHTIDIGLIIFTITGHFPCITVLM